LLKAAVVEGLEAMVPKARMLRGPLAAFRDLVLADATVMRLKGRKVTFPRRRHGGRVHRDRVASSSSNSKR